MQVDYNRLLEMDRENVEQIAALQEYVNTLELSQAQYAFENNAYRRIIDTALDNLSGGMQPGMIARIIRKQLKGYGL